MLRALAPSPLVLALACAPRGQTAPPAVAAAGELARAQALVEGYIDGYLDRDPDVAREAGLHTHDGRVAGASAAAVQESLQFHQRFLEDSAAVDARALPDPLRLDLELARLRAERSVFELGTLRRPRRVMHWNDLFDVSSYLVRDYAPLPERAAKLLDHLEAATGQVDSLLALLEPAQPRTHVETGLKVWRGLKEYLEGDVRAQLQPALAVDQALAARAARVIPAAAAGVERVVRWLEGQALPRATDDFALGEADFLRMLEVNEGLRVSLAELERMAEEDFRRNHQAFVDTARRIDPRLDVQAVAAKIAAERLREDQVIPEASRQLEELLRFIRERDLIGIPTEERARVEVTPPFKRWNSAFLDMAGPFEDVPGSYYYLSPPDPSWPKEVQEAYLPYAGDLLSTSTHEVYPGHFVQGHHQKRAPTRAQKLFESYAFVEGWAHYAEEMMFEAGFGADDPRLVLGQLSNALLRNCRFLAAIGLHTRGMKVEEAERLFREQCFIDPGNARQQAYRGTFDPGYLSYTLGKLQIRALRAEYQAKRGGGGLRGFHDWLLSHGAAPVALIRERL